MYAGAEVGEILDGLETAACHGGERFAGGYEEVAERLAVGAADTASELMQFAETEAVGIVDYDGVDIGHVYAVLDYGGGEEDIVIVVGEVDYGLLKLFGRHLAVGDNNLHSRHEAAELGLKLGEILYAV